MDKIDLILDTVKSLNKRKRRIVIEVTRSETTDYNSIVSIIAGGKHTDIEVVGATPNSLASKLYDEYEFVSNVHINRKYYENPQTTERIDLIPRPQPNGFDPFKNVSDTTYQPDNNFSSFVFSPNNADPAITLDKNGRLNPNSSAISYLGLDKINTFALGYNIIDREIAIIPGHYGDNNEATYKLDARNYASARYFASRYGFIGKRSAFKLVGTSESDGVIAYIFRLVEA